MKEEHALEIMISPGMRRPGKWRGGVLQIWVTRACDKSCFGCTQGSNLRGVPGLITPEQFEQACKTLVDYFGVIGVFGGNPAIHPQFEDLCAILRKYIPKEQRGLWCNNPLGKGAVMRETFNPAVSNLNVHLDKKAYDEFRRDWPEARPFGLDTDSRHSPVYVSMKDLIEDEDTRWQLISNCDINKHWSAMIGVFRGELRGYFCEIAGAQAMLRQTDPNYPDTGVEVVEGWWRSPMSVFAEQVREHCHNCGVPLRGYGELAQAESGVEQTTESYADIYKPKKSNRTVEVVRDLMQIRPHVLPKMTDYLGNAKR